MPPRPAIGAAAWVAGLGLFGCIDYNPVGKPDDPIGHDDSPTTWDSVPDADTADSAPAPLVEECDGVDNDGDGEVDEGFDDHDGDGIADCLDDACEVPLDHEEPVYDANACEVSVAPAADPWALEPLWTYSAPGMTCLHATVADLDQDGTSEIVCVDEYGGVLLVIDGATGTVEWEVTIADDHSTGIALADLDGDGQLEIATFDPSLHVVALRADGSVLWRSLAQVGGQNWRGASLEIAQIDGDGTPDVIGHHAILSGRDGSVLTDLDVDDDWASEREIAVADIDLDGVMDVVDGGQRYSADGSLFWEEADIREARLIIPVLYQGDADGDAEVAWFSEEGALTEEADGAWLFSQAGNFQGLPCAGDIDGDGSMEILSPAPSGDLAHSSLTAWNIAGDTLWIGSFTDITGSVVACTTFDFDLDGAKEVVIADESSMYILDGATGDIKVQEEGRYSNTGGDTPIIADLDGDGSVEILLTNPYGSDGVALKAWSNVNRDWPPGTQMWPSATWSGTSLLPDGSVPRTPHAPWLTAKIWRGQPEVPVFGVDLRPATGDVCVASCADDGEVRVEVRLQNLGPDEAQAGAPLAVYGLDGSGTRVLLEVIALADWLDDGRSAASWEVITTTAQARRGLVFVAGDDGTGTIAADDCDPSNNEATWELEECP